MSHEADVKIRLTIVVPDASASAAHIIARLGKLAHDAIAAEYQIKATPTSGHPEAFYVDVTRLVDDDGDDVEDITGIPAGDRCMSPEPSGMLYCSRKRGHWGPHEAYAGHRSGHPIATWDEER